MFITLTEMLRENGRGVHGYKAVAAAAWTKARAGSEAAAWSFLALLAEDFVERCERMPVSGQELQENFERFAAHVARFDAALGDAAAMLAALNAAASDAALGQRMAS